jgi:uncharacterized protein VirK/YbjX
LDLGNKFAFLRSLLTLAGQSYYWSPGRLFRLAWTISRNIPSQVKVLHILSRPEYLRLARITPRFSVKFLALDYIARGLSVEQHAACFLHHYRRLPDVLSPELLRGVLFDDVIVDEIHADEHCFTVKLGLSRPWDNEGELSLNFEVDGQLVFILSFTIVPGWVVQSEFDEVVLISRLQGVKGRFAEIQLATRSLHDVAPPAVLVAALCGFADVYGIRGMAGVNAHMKPEFHLCEGEAEHIHQAYDKFLTELGGIRAPSGFYLAPIPLPEKPLSLIKKGHKTRTRVKRAFKHEVAARICGWLREPTQRM